MNKQAVAKAASRMERMRRALGVMQSADAPGAIEDAWGDFILAASTFYNALEQGAKTNPESKRWFARKKHERKSDQLLLYMHHARNSEEHGIAAITGRTNSKIVLKPGAGAMLRSDGKNWNVVAQSGDIEFPHDVPILVRVHDDRFGDWFDPPERHLGQEIKGRLPLIVAELAVAYLEGMLAEAAALPD